MRSEDRLARAHALLRQKRFAEAEALCRSVLEQAPGDGAAVHLLGLIRKDAGDVAEGERLLRRSIELEPGRAEFQTNLGNLLRRMGRLQEAERCYREALALDPAHRPSRLGLARTLNELGQYAASEAQCRKLIRSGGNDAEAWSVLAAALRGQHRLAEAESAYRRAITIAPQYGAAYHNLGALLSQMQRADEALAELDRARALGVRGVELAINRGRALMQLYRLDDAEKAYCEAVALQPDNLEAQFGLAQLRYMRGDLDFSRDLEAAACKNRDDTRLQMLLGDVLRRTGHLQRAEAVVRDLMTRKGQTPELRSALATVLHEAGRLKEAETEATEAVRARPHDPTLVENLVAILLSRGQADDALPLIRAQRARMPLRQQWIAYEATAARLRGDPRYRDLYDHDRLVRRYDLDPPPGWNSIEELNTALLESLAARHRFAMHPLTQSVRNGSQTVRSLLTESDPAIRAVLQSFERVVERYRQEIGTDPAHPLTSRNHGRAAFSGCWSVQLRQGGFHVNHVHPEGWISSAYYVAVPEEVGDDDLMPGWIKFGEPRHPVPGATPERLLQPRAGTLVLFPSYMWHGTNPIHGTQPRMTIAFDVVPGRAS